jgi:cobalt/nickel transport system permease protein
MAFMPLEGRALGAGALVAGLAIAVSGVRLASIARAGLVAASTVVLLLVPAFFRDGLLRASLLAGRALLCVTTVMAISATVPIEDLGPALRGLGVPAPLSAVVSATLTQLAVLRSEGERMLLARRLRGQAGYGDVAALLGALLVRAAGRAEKRALAAELRGFAPESAVAKARLSLPDVPLVLAAAIAGAVVHLAGRWP